MRERARSVEATGRRILEAAIHLLGERLYDEVTLADVARDADVTVQTVLRRFGSKEGLTDAAAACAAQEVRKQRWASPSGDLDGAMRVLTEHYETWGDRSLLLLAQEARIEAMRPITEAGRALHHEWVDHVFGPQIAAVRGADRERLRARLIAATDVYVWRIMRRDLGLDAATTALAMRELVAAVVG